MVIYPAGFAAAELAAGRYPLGHARVGWHTYTRNAIYSDISVQSEAPEGPRDAPLRPETYEYWQPTTEPWTWQLDLGAILPFDYVGVAGHTIGTSEAQANIAYSDTGATWTQFSEFAFPTDNAPLMFLGPAATGRYIQFNMYPNVGGLALPPKVAVIHIGIVLAMERSVQSGHRPVTLSRKTVHRPFLSRTGHFLGQNARSTGVAGSASFVGLSASWYRTNFEPFVEEAKNFPFFFAWHPESYPSEVSYVWSTGDIAPSQQLGGIVSVEIDMTGIGGG